MNRNRYLYCALLAVTILVGLGSRRYAEILPDILKKNTGDALWAVAVYLLLAVLAPRAATPRLAACALFISVLVEVSQLYHSSWIDSLRGTTMGALFLGSGFLWTDLVCYALGVGFCAAMEKVLSARWMLPNTRPAASIGVKENSHAGSARPGD